MTTSGVARLAGVIALVGALLAIAHALRPATQIAAGPFTEDGYYALSVAREAALGHGLSIPNGAAWVPTDGVQPLWTIALIPWFSLVHGDRFAPLRWIALTSTAIYLALAVVIARRTVHRARRIGAPLRASGAIALALILGSFSTFAHAHDGLETGLHVLTIALAVGVIDAGAGYGVTAAVFALALWSRLDAALFVAAYGARALATSVRTRRLDFKSIAACATAALSIVPWLVRDVTIDGHIMPTSGRAESLHVHVLDNARAAVLGLVRWTVPILYRPVHHAPWTIALEIALVAAIVAVIVCRPRLALPVLTAGDATLVGYVALLVAFYVFAFGAPFFLGRYLAPALVLTVPWTATWLAQRPRRAIATLSLGAALNAPYFVRSLRGVPARENRCFTEQTAHTLTDVRPECVVGASQSGTLGYFRDRVVNLDGKLNPLALAARERRALPAFVRASVIDVIVDWPVMNAEALGDDPHEFQRRARFGEEHDVWIRVGREGCLRR